MSGPDSPTLPPIARHVDAVLCELDDRVDWLVALSPTNSQALWQAFAASGFTTLPEPAYPPKDPELRGIRRRLLELPIDEVELPTVAALLWEKQREIDRQIELVRLRNSPGLLVASIEMWGEAEFELVAAAEQLLEALSGHRPTGPNAGCDALVAAAEREIARYRARDPRFRCEIVIDPHLSSKLMVSQGNLHIAENVEVPQNQLDALIQHEVGTHSLTRHNGSLQPVTQLKCGLAHYDALQEGLGVLSEHLSGYLAPERLRILAARVIAAQMICHGEDVPAIYHRLVDAYQLAEHDAFDIALRAGRGGGLTKDAVYLRGLRQLQHYLSTGGSFEFLFIGKFAMSQMPALLELEQAGLVQLPALLPTYLDTAEGRARLERCRTLSLYQLAGEDIPA